MKLARSAARRLRIRSINIAANLGRSGAELRNSVSTRKLLKVSQKLSSQKFFFQRVAVGRDGPIADILKFLFLGLADRKSLIYCHIAIDHCWKLRRE